MTSAEASASRWRKPISSDGSSQTAKGETLNVKFRSHNLGKLYEFMLFFRAFRCALEQQVANMQQAQLLFASRLKRAIDFCAPQCHLLQCGKVISLTEPQPSLGVSSLDLGRS